MYSSLVTDLGLSPEVWVFLSLLGCVTLFFKFSRFWSVRNLDLLLLFVLAPGMMMLLVGKGENSTWTAYIWLFVGSGLWLVRCCADLGLARRPLLEPNLNASGLLCLSLGVLGLLLAETVSLPVEEGAGRNPAEPSGRGDRPAAVPGPSHAAVEQVIQMASEIAPLPSSLKRQLPQVIVSRVLASLAHAGLVIGLVAIGWRHFERPLTGFAMAACYLILPYTRMAVVDSGQLIPAALIVGAVVWYLRPAVAGALIGLAAGWLPACLGLIALWCGFYRGRGAIRFISVALAVVIACALVGRWGGLQGWPSALGARSIAEVGLLPQFEPQSPESFWFSIDSSFRLPVLILYLALVVVFSIWPTDKNLAELIALSAALLVASQFWYLDKGGALVMLYLPLAIAMMFRPTLSIRRPLSRTRARDPALPLFVFVRSTDPGPPSDPVSSNRPESLLPMSFQLTYDAIAKRIDHSLLVPTLSLPELEEGCRLAARYQVASVCIKPYAVALAARLLKGSGVEVGTTVGFPHGAHATAVKVFEAQQAMDDGATELDMVINIGQAIGGEWEAVSSDIAAVTRAAHDRGAIVKVIFENCYLNDEQKVRLCQICSEVGADYVKTSTGFGTGGATMDDLRLMRRASPPHVKVKAAGGVRTLDAMIEVAEIGCARIGSSRTAEILDELKARLSR